MKCFHCDLVVNDGGQFTAMVLNEKRFFCCPGCQAIAETICNNGLEKFYQFRSSKNNKAEDLLPQEVLELEALDERSVLATIANVSENTQSIELGIEGITCAACGWLIRTQIAKLPQVQSIEVNATTRRALLKFDANASISPILLTIRKLGYRAFPFSEDAQEKSLQAEAKNYNRRLIVAGLAMMQVMMFATGLYIGDYQDISTNHAFFLHSVSGLLATPVVFYSALPFFKSAWSGLKQKHFGMNLPVSIAILAAYFSSIYSLLSDGRVYYFDSVVMFTFFLLLGRSLEQRARLKAVLKQQNFKRLLPLSVTRRKSDGRHETIPTASINPGDHIIINAGGVIPVDGILLSSSADINEAVISGEFLPVNKSQGEVLYSGSTNNSGGLEIEATTTSDQCRLQKLIQLQHDSENIQSNRITLADRIASVYVVALLILCGAAGIVWSQIDPDRAFPVVLSLLVVSCPCALSLATPAAVAATIAHLTDLGLMIKSSNLLPKLSKTSQIFFDKTGTLTLGNLRLLKTIVHTDCTQQKCLEIACSLESISGHPIAHAFKSVSANRLKINNIKEVIGGGLTGEFAGDSYYLGKRLFVEAASNARLTLTNEIQDNLTEGSLSLFLVKNNEHIATFYLVDTTNPSAYKTVTSLSNKGIRITLLSGDSQTACDLLARSLKIDQVIANATPESKLATIKHAKSADSTILMVGDGINDIGALAQADISITLGSAAHLSKAASSAVLVSHDLMVIYQAIETAKKLERIVRQNLSWAVAYNLFAIPFAAAGMVPAWLAAVGMTSSSLVVVLNALRLRR